MQFWFEFASTYSYLAAARIEALAGAAGVALEWRAFLLGPIFVAQGWNDSPFNVYPAKGRYMWRDMERLCEGYGLRFRKPSAFPRNGLLAARVTCLAAAEPWCPAFVRGVYAANFADDREIGKRDVIEEILTDIGQPATEVIAAAEQEANKLRLRAYTDGAAARGIFGAPSFIAAGELFWGNDRLEAALAWARSAETKKAEQGEAP